VLFNSYDDSGFWGNSAFDRRHVFNFYYIYDLPFYRTQTGAVGKVLGGWQVTGATFMRTGTPFWVTEAADLGGTGDTFAAPWNIVGDPHEGVNREFSQGVGADNNFFINPAAFQRPAAGTFGNGKREEFYNPGQYQWDIALFKNVGIGGTRNIQFRAEIFNFLNHANLNNVDGTTNTQNGGGSGTPTTATFGRVTGKDNSRRDIQLSLRFLF
jgi:hypothetical protein